MSNTVDPKLKKFVGTKGHYGAFNEFIDLLDTPPKYTDPNDIPVVSDDQKHLVFKNPLELLSDLIGDVLNLKTFKYEFINTSNFDIIHNMNTKYIFYKIYDEDGYEFLPNQFKIVNDNIVNVDFAYITSGYIVLIGLLF